MRVVVGALQAVTQLLVLPAHPGRRPRRVLAPVSRFGVELGRSAALSGEDLHDTTDRFRTVERRGGAAQNLDAIDLLQGDKLQRRRAQRGRTDAHTVDQYQGMRAVGAANEQTLRATRPTALGKLDAGLTREQFAQRRLARCFDFFTINH